MTARRWAGERISGSVAPRWGVKRLNQTLAISGWAAPEGEELIEITRTLDDLGGDGAVDGDLGTLDALEDAFVGGGLAAFVVFRLETVDGDDYVQLFVPLPKRGNGAKGAGDDLGVDAAGFELRK